MSVSIAVLAMDTTIVNVAAPRSRKTARISVIDAVDHRLYYLVFADCC
jgi:hypothetical protein